MTRVVAVDGVAPGVGKSTLVAALATCYGTDRSVARFDEADVLSHPACAELADEFRTRGRVGPAACLRAAQRYLDWLAERDIDVAVVDALFPFIPSLYGWGHDEAEIDEFFTRLRALSGAEQITFVYLDGDPRIALERACAREQDGWLAWLIGTLAGATGGGPTDLDSLCDYLVARRELTLRLLAQHGWSVVRLADATTQAAGELAAEAQAVLTARSVGSSGYQNPSRGC